MLEVKKKKLWPPSDGHTRPVPHAYAEAKVGTPEDKEGVDHVCTKKKLWPPTDGHTSPVPHAYAEAKVGTPEDREGVDHVCTGQWRNLRGLYELDVAGARLTRRVRLAPPTKVDIPASPHILRHWVSPLVSDTNTNSRPPHRKPAALLSCCATLPCTAQTMTL